MNPFRAAQVAVAGRLLASAEVAALVAATTDGPAIFAEGQPFADRYPRVTLSAPQWIPAAGSCGRAGELIFTIHAWARGPDCTLAAGDLANAVELALATPPTLADWRVSSSRFEGSRPVGDPAPGVEHFVSTYRISVQRTA